MWIVALAATMAMAHAQPIVTMLHAEKKVVETGANGREIVRFVPVATILPGEEVRYTVSFTNAGEAPASGVVISLPIPADMTLIPGSAGQAGATIAYSVDGGATFDQLERLTVTTPEGLVRPATAADVTTVQWTIAAELEAGQSGSVSCAAVVE